MQMKTARPVASLRQGRTEWYRIINKVEARQATIHVFDEIGYFGVTAKNFVDELNNLDVDFLDVRLNTPGGDVFDGITIMNSLKNHPATVTTYVDGMAASIGSVILQAGDHRIAARASQVMIHESFGMVVGNSADMREQADLLDRISGTIAEVYADRSGGNAEDWRAAMKAETWYSAEEAVKAGLVDEIAGTSKADNSWDLSIYAHTGRAAASAPVLPDPIAIDIDEIQNALRGAFK